jgi:hypothetical protein
MAKRPSLSTPIVKSLFAYSGNQCAMPTCVNSLVDASGTILGKIAHICSASPGGTRYDKSMTEAERHSASNLFIVCGACHDIVDDPNNEAAYPAPLLRKYKKQHEDRFRKAERQLIAQFVDATQINQPVYPKTLKVYGAELEASGVARELKEISAFIDSLKELPLNERQFAIKLAERMDRNGVDELDAHATLSAFRIGQSKFKTMMSIIENNNLGHIAERGFNQYAVVLREEWLKVYAYCREENIPPEDVFIDLNFGLLDEH